MLIPAIKFYLGKDYPACFDLRVYGETLDIAEEPADSDFLLFPVFYEILHEYSAVEYEKYGYSAADVLKAQQNFQNLLEISQQFKKELIVFYYRDPCRPLEIPNSIVFRTSLYKSHQSGEFGLPAFIPDSKELIQFEKPEVLPKEVLPKIAFRGQASPINLGWKADSKIFANRILKYLGSGKRFNTFHIRGYLARRSAILSLNKANNIEKDIRITSWSNDPHRPDYKIDFLNNLFDSPYNICASGFGNYSFRLYEVLSAGRIPVFINTDCVLPFEGLIDWKKHVVWVDEGDAAKTAEVLLDFHQGIHPDDFRELQISNRKLWGEYLTHEGFLRHMPLLLYKMNSK